jgi:predicted regulator of Ras-like GTPase activity (Roadblock/LC7/MglB family)
MTRPSETPPRRPSQPDLTETTREQARTGFTSLLEEIVVSCPGAVAAIFSDAEGETVDYCTFLEVFDTQITGAQWGSVVAGVRDLVAKVGQGELDAVHVRGTERDFLIQLVGEGYYLTLVLSQGMGWGHALQRARELARELHRESGF